MGESGSEFESFLSDDEEWPDRDSVEAMVEGRPGLTVGEGDREGESINDGERRDQVTRHNGCASWIRYLKAFLYPLDLNWM